MSQWEPIAGETPIDDVSGLKVRGIRNRAALNGAEAENIRRVVVKYLAAAPSRRMAPFHFTWVKRLHREMFGRVWKWAGVIRSSELNLGVAAHLIEPQSQDLLEPIAMWEKEGRMPWVEQAALIHYRAVAIHPFLNGNGRWARMLSNIWLRRHKQPTTNWPEETVGAESKIRAEYLAAVREADQGRFEGLMELHRRFAQIGEG